MKKITVLVVDDSAFMRRMLQDMINSDPDIEVVAVARNGEAALKKTLELKPHVITLDVELYEENGLDVLTKIMAQCPTPTLMVSFATQKGADVTLEAVRRGAVDFIAKPSGQISLDIEVVKEELIEKIKRCREMDLRINGNLADNKHEERKRQADDDTKRRDPLRKIICIGASTGGPKALYEVITRFPKDLQAPVLVVQHMPSKFTKSLAERLNETSLCNVSEAVQGEIIQNGHVYIAPGGYHMTIKEDGKYLRIDLIDTPPLHGVKPAFDLLLQSLCPLNHDQFIIAILTGMGKDGAEGTKQLKKRTSCYTIAESRETAVVFGMPKMLIETVEVDEVLPIYRVASSIINQVY
ncbi:chemotaxis-specific protein-glutamate methyltransferase CheB [Terrilactibacillus sp. BCM23-1]|uniref:Protein-glutamate methylesterase/protein-glutamine glutaminase n=1 Tax=Terrilactibacillus tamarindi TaxID=2599694 RepID=A0A6N8CPY8_9BACI|nr:chemotaxis response regulator protein-glutamate methylesterase [Terrilactibacillus tamarindi]MTT32259.1 chemotaxis-specific protein-glutamate methyltransferase CheB [Terrilactibacillus tamarindi]